jgi:aspartyl-tRNA(Asn)/glutamyl-tRNA(Gln) amidotransferase subunit B
MADTPYTIVIGLEVHVQLTTESKMFSWCGTEFGLPPNTQCDPVSLGLPGTLPVMNRKAFDLALKTALACHATITPFTKWDRKNYYYPDLPKNYQISQYDLPFSTGGWLDIPARKDGSGGGRCTLTRIHLEEDTGKLVHDAGAFSEVDLNRAGIPLMEIVSEPELRYRAVSDCEMQEGSLRCDANVNIHIPIDGGKPVATPIVEIKNLNSFSAVERAIQYEAERQYEQWQKDKKTIRDAPKQTRGWSEPDRCTKPQREKETAADYRYFPEPDLVPVVVDAAWIDRIRATIGELPTDRRARFEGLGLSAYDANVLVEQGEDVADYFDAVAGPTAEPKLAANWIQQDVLRVAKERKIGLAEFPVQPEALAELILRVKKKELNTNQGREVLNKMIETGQSAAQIIAAEGYGMVSDRDAIEAAVEAALSSNPQALADLRGGKKKPDAVKGWLRGQVMKATGGKADPSLVVEVMETKLAEILSSADG